MPEVPVIQRRSCLSYNSNDGIIKVEDHKGNKHQLCKDELKDDSLVLNWLSSVISTLDSGYVGNKLELHRILVKVRTDLNNHHQAQYCAYLQDLQMVIIQISTNFYEYPVKL